MEPACSHLFTVLFLTRSHSDQEEQPVLRCVAIWQCVFAAPQTTGLLVTGYCSHGYRARVLASLGLSQLGGQGLLLVLFFLTIPVCCCLLASSAIYLLLYHLKCTHRHRYVKRLLVKILLGYSIWLF